MRKFWRIYKYFAIVIVTGFLADLLIVMSFSVYRPEIKKADAIVILGAAINTPALYNRSLEGLRLYEAGKGEVLVLSGGVDYPKSIPEAEYMKQVIEQNASSSLKMVLDPDSHSTYENLQNTKAKIGEGKSIIIVSDSYHLARGVLVAVRAGFYPVYWSSPKQTHYSTSELAFYYLREMMAMISYVPKFILG